jgi:DNA helicase HerA-like ATPase
MSETPLRHVDGLRIGSVDFVSPDEIKILLDIEAPESVALNAGDARPFPRVNGYILIPVDDAYVVGQVEWLTVERSSFPKRRGVQDFGVIDLPYPLRRMSVNPLGRLRQEGHPDVRYAFKRGADSLPSIGAPVMLPTVKQLRSIVESGAHQRVRIGTSALAGNAEVRIDPDRLFGRHLAVLGNTGSGKSCSVAGLIRWSLEAARNNLGGLQVPNARFLVLDPNGEYARAFGGKDDSITARIFRVSPEEGELPLKVPLWFWNSAEWSSFTQASPRVQRPLLRRALRDVKAGNGGKVTSEDKKLALRRTLTSHVIAIQRDLRSGAIKSEETKFGFRLKAISLDLKAKGADFPETKLQDVVAAIDAVVKATLKTFVKDGKPIEYFNAFTEAQVQTVIDALSASLTLVGGVLPQEGPDEDTPRRFSGSDLADHLQIVAEQENASQFVDFLISRIRTFLSDTRIDAVVGEKAETTLEEWLNNYIGQPDAANGQLAIVDLSLVPSEVVHVVTAVAARMVFEALQRFRRVKGVALPTVLVMEEAHTFIKRYKDDVDNHDAATVCCQVFERIAREGRKFGLGLVLSSQRPSELSQTVLSQCNTFLLHRLSNDRDQELVKHLVPDNLRGLLRELPSLPSQGAILLGWASELPVLVRMDDLPQHQRPRSDDPDFWDVWIGKTAEGAVVDRKADWKVIAEEWGGSTDVAKD